MINIWALRTIDKATLKDFLRKTTELKQFMILLLSTVTLFKYKPESVLNREKKRASQSKKNIDKLSELNKLHSQSSAISMLRKNQSLPRSTSMIDTNITNGNSSVRSWKAVR